MKNDPCWTSYKMVGSKKKGGKTVPNCVASEGFRSYIAYRDLDEVHEEKQLELFAKKRHEGAKKISDMAKEKGGVAFLTHDHFIVKLPYYERASKGELKTEEMKSEYKKLCSELHSSMNNIEAMDQSKFQKLVGRIEVLGELLIETKHE